MREGGIYANSPIVKCGNAIRGGCHVGTTETVERLTIGRAAQGMLGVWDSSDVFVVGLATKTAINLERSNKRPQLLKRERKLLIHKGDIAFGSLAMTVEISRVEMLRERNRESLCKSLCHFTLVFEGDPESPVQTPLR